MENSPIVVFENSFAVDNSVFRSFHKSGSFKAFIPSEESRNFHRLCKRRCGLEYKRKPRGFMHSISHRVLWKTTPCLRLNFRVCGLRKTFIRPKNRDLTHFIEFSSLPTRAHVRIITPATLERSFNHGCEKNLSTIKEKTQQHLRIPRSYGNCRRSQSLGASPRQRTRSDC